MHQSQTSGGDSWFPLRMGYTGSRHVGRAVERAPGRSLMADEHTPGTDSTEEHTPADRPSPSPWEPAAPPPPSPSPWAPAAQSPWPPAPPPAWQVGAPVPPGWATTPVAAPPRPVGRRPFLLAALTGAVVGALVAGLVVAAVKDDR